MATTKPPLYSGFLPAILAALYPGVEAHFLKPILGPFFQAQKSALRAKPIFAPAVFCEIPIFAKAHFRPSQNKHFSHGPFFATCNA